MKIFADAVENYYRRENPVNEPVNFIGPSPLVSYNSEGRFPNISPEAFIGPFSSIIGDVTIEDNVFIAPNVSIRADEGTPFFIGKNTNIQDGAVLHGLKEEWVVVNGERYSIYIGSGVTCAHGSIVHGPCVVGDDTFVGFKAMVFNAIIGKGSFISNNATVTGGIKIAPHRLVPIGALIDTQEKADALELVPKDKEEFSKEVQDVNREFPSSYSI